jgi:hypothetical protein
MMTERTIQKDFICIREFLHKEMNIMRILLDDRNNRIEVMQLIRIHSRLLIFFQTQFEIHVIIQFVRDQRIVNVAISSMNVYKQTIIRQRFFHIRQNHIQQIQLVIKMRIRQNVRDKHIRYALQLMRQIIAKILRKSFSQRERICNMLVNQRLIKQRLQSFFRSERCDFRKTINSFAIVLHQIENATRDLKNRMHHVVDRTKMLI